MIIFIYNRHKPAIYGLDFVKRSIKMGPDEFKTICITNRPLCRGDFIERISAVAKTHPYAIILREKELCAREYAALAVKVMEICRVNGVRCILHTFVDIAVSLGSEAIHLPMDVLRSADESLLSRFGAIGASCHSAQEAVEAEKRGCSYITAGHIYATDCKKGVAPRGIEFLREVCGSVSIPVYAVGGIDRARYGELIRAGAAGACIMSGFMCGSIQ